MAMQIFLTVVLFIVAGGLLYVRHEMKKRGL
jgi:hypothetical protein